MNKSLKYAFLNFVQEHRLISSGDRLLVAISGGMDSVVLLHLLLEWQQYFRIEIGVAHFNHQLRGAAADGDEQFVRDLAEKNNLPFFCDRGDVQNFATNNRLSLEAAARNLRENFLQNCAKTEGYDVIATAHHLNDQAETMLMRMIQGSGVSGLAGIRLRRKNIIRPLLFAHRREIEAYATEHQLTFRTDATNEDERFLRNRIRRQLLPVIQDQFQLGELTPFLRQSLILQDWLAEINRQVENAAKNHLIKFSENKIALELTTYKGYFSGIQINLIEMIIEWLENEKSEISYNQFLGLNRWLESPSNGSSFALTSQIAVFRDKKYLCFEKSAFASPVFAVLVPGELLTLPDHDFTIRMDWVDKNDGIKNPDPHIEFLDASRFSFPVIIRNWQPGDRFRPLGLAGSKKIKDFLTDCRIRSSQKKRTLVMDNQGEIAVVLGVRISELYKITDASHTFLKIEIRKI